MIVKLSHYVWIVLAYLLGAVGGSVAGGVFSSLIYADGIGPWLMRIIVGAVLGSSLLSGVVAMKLTSNKRVVACYAGLTLALQAGTFDIWWTGLVRDIPHILWFSIPLVAYFLVTWKSRVAALSDKSIGGV